MEYLLPYREIADIERDKAPKSELNKIVYLYDWMDNTYIPGEWQGLKINPKMDYNDIDTVNSILMTPFSFSARLRHIFRS